MRGSKPPIKRVSLLMIPSGSARMLGWSTRPRTTKGGEEFEARDGAIAQLGRPDQGHLRIATLALRPGRASQKTSVPLPKAYVVRREPGRTLNGRCQDGRYEKTRFRTAERKKGRIRRPGNANPLRTRPLDVQLRHRCASGLGQTPNPSRATPFGLRRRS